MNLEAGANTFGGILLIGVLEDQARPKALVGVPNRILTSSCRSCIPPTMPCTCHAPGEAFRHPNDLNRIEFLDRTGPASRAWSTSTLSIATVIVDPDRSSSDLARLSLLRRAFSTHGSTSAEALGRDSCPCNADSSLCASPNQSSTGPGSRLPREQIVR